MSKHVYENDVTEWFVAESAAHARQLCLDQNRLLGHQIPEEELDLDFRQCPDDKVLDMRDHGPTGERVKKTCAEFAAEMAPGFLGTTEY